ncbi:MULTISPECIES: hypothetical protein [unclassified Methanosarcina]|nr:MULTISPECIES: hypothetical protein [unclassified Methanosarcina]
MKAKYGDFSSWCDNIKAIYPEDFEIRVGGITKKVIGQQVKTKIKHLFKK